MGLSRRRREEDFLLEQTAGATVQCLYSHARAIPSTRAVVGSSSSHKLFDDEDEDISLSQQLSMDLPSDAAAPDPPRGILKVRAVEQAPAVSLEWTDEDELDSLSFLDIYDDRCGLRAMTIESTMPPVPLETRARAECPGRSGAPWRGSAAVGRRRR
jgi:hypothetical protein